MTLFVQKPPMSSPHISVFIYDGLCLFEFACVAEIFGLPRPEFGDQWYTFKTVSLNNQPIKTQYNGLMAADDLLSNWRPTDTIIVPGWTHFEQPVPDQLAETLAQASAAGVRILSICSGVFVLAAAGLLNGKSATTHWKYTDHLKASYPQIDVQPDVLFIDHGKLMTSAGSAAGLDLCLHLVRKDFGSKVVNQVSKRLVVSPIRAGNQAQFIESKIKPQQRTDIAGVLATMQANLSTSFTNKILAQQVNMSERNFLRHFKSATGTTPGAWLSEQRIQFAKQLLEQTNFSMDDVAEQCGFGTATTLRHHFRERMKLSPMAYRKQFKAPAL